MKYFSWVLIAAALLVIGFILFSGNSGKPLLVGDRISDFRLTDLSGNYFFLNDHRGKVVILNFAATWCTYCLEELPYLEGLKQKYAEEGLTVTSVFQDYSNIDLAREIKVQNRLSFPVLTDREGDIFNKFGVRALPCTVIIDREAVIRYIHTGFRPEDIRHYEREINSLLKEGND